MNVFKQTTWKWWELRIVSGVGLLLGLALGTYFAKYLVDWLWLIWLGFIIFYIYVLAAWLKKID